MDLSVINDKLAGYSVLLKMVLEAGDSASRYLLRLDLGEAESAGSRAISVSFDNVAKLSVSDVGGGLTQFLCLRAADIRDRQWDGINLKVRDLERESISFLCQSVGQIDNYRIGD